MTPLERARAAIITCDRCPRLRRYCARIAREKRPAYRDDTYWGRPVPGFGDPQARLLVLGLAPAAHGANRTGRVFTGDGAGGSGEFLMAAMHEAGFANQATSQRADDGLELRDAFIAAAVRCAPPGNRPSPAEVANCQMHLDAEIAALPRLAVVVALGRLATDAYCRWLGRQGWPLRRVPFAHGAVYDPGVPPASRVPRTRSTPEAPVLVMSYHPSRQNTHTGRLTRPMLAAVFSTARQLLDGDGTQRAARDGRQAPAVERGTGTHGGRRGS